MSTIRFHGQTGEDFLLWEYFGHRSRGFYIEIGAFDGIYMSNSYVFEQQGWSGICIEAIPKYAQLCVQNRPQATCLQMACVGDEKLEEVEFSVEEMGIVSGIAARSDDPGLANTYRFFGQPFTGFEKIMVPAATLNRILATHLPDGTDIDFISLDVEGKDIEVLRALDFDRYGPKVLLVEANTQNDFRILENFLCGDRGYQFARKHTWNYFFVRKDQDAKALASIYVNCRVEGQNHPLGSQYSLPPQEVRQK
jgi:FkbM family methyltransferase